MNIKPMIKELMKLNNLNFVIPENENDQENTLKTLMTISRSGKLSDEYYHLEKEYLIIKKNKKQLTHVDDISEELIEGIYIFKGDITTIQADAIVNAANEKLLGCFIPGHHCIDNAIHLSAGLGLRNECNDIMIKQGHDEEVGQAKVTKGYNLPSKYVIHTVGPNVNGLKVFEMDKVKTLLKQCYMSILNEIATYEDISNVVFCSISTGVYGVPISIASEVALTTIIEYLENNKHYLNKVIINVFSEEDYHVYKNKAKEITNR